MSSHSRFAELMSKVLDDAIFDEEIIELHALVDAEPSLRSQLVDHLLLDTLLEENLGQEPLTALVDLVGGTARTLGSPTPVLARERTLIDSSTTITERRWHWMSGWLVLAASLLVVISLFTFLGNREAVASASQIVRAAMQTHAAPIERIYVVEINRSETNDAPLELPRQVRVHTQGKQFYVEMDGEPKRWVWGRNIQGDFWIAIGRHRAMRIEASEAGAPLQFIGDLYGLELESLLDSLNKYCKLTRSDESELLHVITAIPERRWQRRIQSAVIEVDRETKAVRRLVLRQSHALRGEYTVTFTLVDSAIPEDSKYTMEGHLDPPFNVFSRDSKPDQRRTILSNWNVMGSEKWINQEKP